MFLESMIFLHPKDFHMSPFLFLTWVPSSSPLRGSGHTFCLRAAITLRPQTDESTRRNSATELMDPLPPQSESLELASQHTVTKGS